MPTKDKNHKTITKPEKYKKAESLVHEDVHDTTDDGAPPPLYLFDDNVDKELALSVCQSDGAWMIQYATWDSNKDKFIVRRGVLMWVTKWPDLISFAKYFRHPFYFTEMLKKYFDESEPLICITVCDTIDSNNTFLDEEFKDLPSNKYPIFVWKADEPEKKYELVLDSRIVSEDVNKEQAS